MRIPRPGKKFALFSLVGAVATVAGVTIAFVRKWRAEERQDEDYLATVYKTTPLTVARDALRQGGWVPEQCQVYAEGGDAIAVVPLAKGDVRVRLRLVMDEPRYWLPTSYTTTSTIMVRPVPTEVAERLDFNDARATLEKRLIDTGIIASGG